MKSGFHKKMKVYCLLGPCGAGKSTLLHRLPPQIERVNEGYVPQDQLGVYIDNRLNLSKFRYVNDWLLAMLNLKKNSHALVVCDGCPYEVSAYVEEPDIWFNLVRKCFSELQSDFGITVETIYIDTSLENTISRVKHRLKTEPWRIDYHEDDEEFVRNVWKYFNVRLRFWDHVVANDGEISDALSEIEKIIQYP